MRNVFLRLVFAPLVGVGNGAWLVRAQEQYLAYPLASVNARGVGHILYSGTGVASLSVVMRGVGHIVAPLTGSATFTSAIKGPGRVTSNLSGSGSTTNATARLVGKAGAAIDPLFPAIRFWTWKMLPCGCPPCAGCRRR